MKHLKGTIEQAEKTTFSIQYLLRELRGKMWKETQQGNRTSAAHYRHLEFSVYEMLLKRGDKQ